MLEDGTISDEAEVYALLKKVCNPSYKFCQGLTGLIIMSITVKLLVSIQRLYVEQIPLFIEWTQLIISYGLKSKLMHL